MKTKSLKYYSCRYNGNVYVGDIMELITIDSRSLTSDEFNRLDNYETIIGHYLQVHEIRNIDFNDSAVVIFNDLTFFDKNGYTNYIILPPRFLKKSIRGERTYKLKKLRECK